MSTFLHTFAPNNSSATQCIPLPLHPRDGFGGFLSASVTPLRGSEVAPAGPARCQALRESGFSPRTWCMRSSVADGRLASYCLGLARDSRPSQGRRQLHSNPPEEHTITRVNAADDAVEGGRADGEDRNFSKRDLRHLRSTCFKLGRPQCCRHRPALLDASGQLTGGPATYVVQDFMLRVSVRGSVEEPAPASTASLSPGAIAGTVVGVVLSVLLLGGWRRGRCASAGATATFPEPRRRRAGQHAGDAVRRAEPCERMRRACRDHRRRGARRATAA